MSAHASRAQVLAAALPVQPPADLSAGTAPVSTTVTGLQAVVAGSAAAQGADSNGAGSKGADSESAHSKRAELQNADLQPAAPASARVTAAEAFATQAPAEGEQATTAKQDKVLATTTTQAPAVAGRPGTVATVAKSSTPVQSPATAGSIGGAVLALVLVVGLILALGWIARRLPGFRGAGNTNALRVVSSLSLGPRERVVVVAVGETQLLIGVGAGGMRTLHTLEQPLPTPAPAATPAFAQLLAQHFGKKA